MIKVFLLSSWSPSSPSGGASAPSWGPHFRAWPWTAAVSCRLPGPEQEQPEKSTRPALVSVSEVGRPVSHWPGDPGSSPPGQSWAPEDPSHTPPALSRQVEECAEDEEARGELGDPKRTGIIWGKGNSVKQFLL